MATRVQTKKKRLNMAERAQEQLERHFPNFEPSWLWIRTVNAGFTTLPRTMPVVMQAIDARTKNQPAGHTLFCLWARSPDNPLITIENPAIFAAEAGFSGERAVNTWRRRMKQLVELKFIMAKKGTSGDYHYVLLLNPNAAMEHMHMCGNVQEDLYFRFSDRLTDIGASEEIKEIHEYWRLQTEGPDEEDTEEKESVPRKAMNSGKVKQLLAKQKANKRKEAKSTLAPKAPVREGPAPRPKNSKMPEPPMKKMR